MNHEAEQCNATGRKSLGRVGSLDGDWELGGDGMGGQDGMDHGWDQAKEGQGPFISFTRRFELCKELERRRRVWNVGAGISLVAPDGSCPGFGGDGAPREVPPLPLVEARRRWKVLVLACTSQWS